MLGVRFLWFLIVLPVIWASNAAAQLAPYTLQTEDKARLQNGEAVTHVWRDKSREDGAIDVYGAIDVAASPETIWAVMLNCELSVKIVKDMKYCTVTETAPDASWDIRQQVFSLGFPLPEVKTEFKSVYTPYRTITISREGGDMKVQDGVWTLQILDKDNTRITYRAAVLPKLPVPKGWLKKATRKDTPEILMKLRETVSEQKRPS